MWGSNGNAHIVNGLVDAVGEGEDGMSWDRSIETHPLPYVKQKPHGNVPLRVGNSN